VRVCVRACNGSPVKRLINRCGITHSQGWYDSFMCDMTHLQVWRNSFISVPWLIDMRGMIHWYVLHDSFIRVPWYNFVCHDSFISMAWLILRCDMTRWCAGHDSFIRVPWLIHMCAMTHLYVPWLIHRCDVTRWCVWHALSRTRAMTHSYHLMYSYVWRDSFTRGTWLIHITWCIHMCDVTHSHVVHDSFICEEWLMYTVLDGYCSTVQGLLDWFEVDKGFTELLFIQIDLCVMCVFVLHD